MEKHAAFRKPSSFLALCVAVIPLLFLSSVSATNKAQSPADVTQSDYNPCIVQTSERYNIDAGLIKAIIFVESNNNPKVININPARNGKNSTEDVGLMQINSEWLPVLKRFGIQRGDLFHPCTNIAVGVWILAQEIARFGGTWEAVGAYNAGPHPDKRQRRLRYAQKVRAAFHR